MWGLKESPLGLYNFPLPHVYSHLGALHGSHQTAVPSAARGESHLDPRVPVHGTHTHTPLWTSQSVARASSSNLVPSAVNWLCLQCSYCGVFYTQKRSRSREWCLHLFCASKSINGLLLPYSQLKERSEPHTWNLEPPTIRSHVLSGKKMKSNMDYGVGSGDEFSSWLYYHIKEHTVPVIILGQSRFKTFSIKSFQATAQLGCIWYILWPVCWNFATVWNPQLWPEQHGALGAICNFIINRKYFIKTIFSIGTIPLIWTIGLDYPHEVGSEKQHAQIVPAGDQTF